MSDELLDKIALRLKAEAELAECEEWGKSEARMKERVEVKLDEAINIMVVHGLDAKFFENSGWAIGHTDSLTIPAGAQERIRKMLSERDALRDRSCDGCAKYGKPRCPVSFMNPADEMRGYGAFDYPDNDFACNRWRPREGDVG